MNAVPWGNHERGTTSPNQMGALLTRLEDEELGEFAETIRQTQAEYDALYQREDHGCERMYGPDFSIDDREIAPLTEEQIDRLVEGLKRGDTYVPIFTVFPDPKVLEEGVTVMRTRQRDLAEVRDVQGDARTRLWLAEASRSNEPEPEQSRHPRADSIPGESIANFPVDHLLNRRGVDPHYRPENLVSVMGAQTLTYEGVAAFDEIRDRALQEDPGEGTYTHRQGAIIPEDTEQFVRPMITVGEIMEGSNPVFLSFVRVVPPQERKTVTVESPEYMDLFQNAPTLPVLMTLAAKLSHEEGRLSDLTGEANIVTQAVSDGIQAYVSPGNYRPETHGVISVNANDLHVQGISLAGPQTMTNALETIEPEWS